MANLWCPAYHTGMPRPKSVKQPSMHTLKQRLETLFARDAAFASERDAHYKSSWKQRGGNGAFFTIVRPMDRFQAIAERGIPNPSEGQSIVQPWDIFGIIRYEQSKGLTQNDDGTLQACIRDLRIYMALLAVEAASWVANPYSVGHGSGSAGPGGVRQALKAGDVVQTPLGPGVAIPAESGQCGLRVETNLSQPPSLDMGVQRVGILPKEEAPDFKLSTAGLVRLKNLRLQVSGPMVDLLNILIDEYK